MTKQELLQRIAETKARSQWKQGVKAYAMEMVTRFEVEEMPRDNTRLLRLCLAGARDFDALSYGGMYEIYDRDIAVLLCTPSEYRRTHEGEKAPNSRETWLGVQARALYQAYLLILECVRK